ncbi:gamma-glutamyltransferase family protein [Spirulina major CS-329]|uniref:gamma-glutamyltransferase family protein n=1 Tax=Spirulina TaxID=1154 RepID=UPI00232DB41B|nr:MULTISPECIES: gamma-glutamyltransferase family protein [Spirulina]MDB9494457.1 gamma-glutamyltransferase family protein [Spirulina subsalsa CS-330]MDB9501584.1 gamma-glutamyltransferase family protein [Spirulina major CS-329]
MTFLDYPYASQRRVTFGTRAMVATSQHLASLAGWEMFQAGGNAVDAAVATAIALTVVEPTANGIGSDAFAIVWDGQQLHGLNGSGRSPAAMERDRYGDTIPTTGWPTVTVPGAVSAWHTLWERWGTLPFAQLCAPAIRYAAEGFPVSPVTAQTWEREARRFAKVQGEEYEAFKAVFFPDGRAPQAGEIWRSPGHAATLQTLADEGCGSFYQGSLSDRIVKFAAQTGGLLTAADLAAHRADWVTPISTAYRDVTVWEIPPNTQGIAALMALNILEGFDLAADLRDSVASFHRQIEAMKLAFADTYRYVGDPGTMALTTADLLSKDYAAQRRGMISDRALPLADPGFPKGGTVYLCTADETLMVSFIQSNFENLGSGVLVPETGISLQNRACGFSLDPGHPNELAPHKRPFHTIIPAFLTRNGQALGPFGVMGAQMQPQGHVQMVVNTTDYGMNPQTALDAPRWRFLRDNRVLLETGVNPDLAAGLEAIGHRVSITPAAYEFGKGQMILRHGATLVGGTEPRADGSAIAR